VNINPWLQFGKHGYTTPSATAHKGLCTYSKTRLLCPLPTDCEERIPSKDINTKYSLIKDETNGGVMDGHTGKIGHIQLAKQLMSLMENKKPI
jgi:hypothetical protein